MVLCIELSYYSVEMCQLKNEIVLGNSTLACALKIFHFLLWMQACMQLNVEPSWHPVVLHQLRIEVVLRNSTLICLCLFLLS